MATRVIDRIRAITDKPIKYVTLSHYHAVRVLGSSAYQADLIVSSDACRAMIHERGREDWESELARFPRLFQGADSIPGLTWPTVTFSRRMSIYVGKRWVDLIHPGRAHTAGDIVAWIPDARAVFAGDIIEHRTACYCGDAHFAEWPDTIDAIASLRPHAFLPGRGEALIGEDRVGQAFELTREFLEATYRPVAAVAAAGGSLKDALAACKAACDRRFGLYAIYEHCLPFNIARAYDEALGIDTPRIWTAKRDRELWEALEI